MSIIELRNETYAEARRVDLKRQHKGENKWDALLTKDTSGL
jgi:hypothetical protein